MNRYPKAMNRFQSCFDNLRVGDVIYVRRNHNGAWLLNNLALYDAMEWNMAEFIVVEIQAPIKGIAFVKALGQNIRGKADLQIITALDIDNFATKITKAK